MRSWQETITEERRGRVASEGVNSGKYASRGLYSSKFEEPGSRELLKRDRSYSSDFSTGRFRA